MVLSEIKWKQPKIVYYKPKTQLKQTASNNLKMMLILHFELSWWFSQSEKINTEHTRFRVVVAVAIVFARWPQNKFISERDPANSVFAYLQFEYVPSRWRRVHHVLSIAHANDEKRTPKQ